VTGEYWFKKFIHIINTPLLFPQKNRVPLLPEEKSGSQSETRAQLDIPALYVVKVVIRSAACSEGKLYHCGIWFRLMLCQYIVPVVIPRKSEVL